MLMLQINIITTFGTWYDTTNGLFVIANSERGNRKDENNDRKLQTCSCDLAG